MGCGASSRVDSITNLGTVGGHKSEKKKREQGEGGMVRGGEGNPNAKSAEITYSEDIASKDGSNTRPQAKDNDESKGEAEKGGKPNRPTAHFAVNDAKEEGEEGEEGEEDESKLYEWGQSSSTTLRKTRKSEMDEFSTVLPDILSKQVEGRDGETQSFVPAALDADSTANRPSASLVAMEKELMNASSEELLLSYQLATAVGGLGIWDWHIKANVLYWNSVMFDIFETKREDFDNTYASFRSVVHPDDREFVDTNAMKAVSEKRDFHLRFRLLTKSGKLKYLDGHGKLTIEDGEVVKMTGVNVDVTEKVLLEQRKVDMEGKREALRERARMAEEHNEQNLAFISHLCHELRNPMVGICGSLSLAEDEAKLMRRRLERAKEALEHLSHTAAHLHNMASSGEGRGEHESLQEDRATPCHSERESTLSDASLALTDGDNKKVVSLSRVRQVLKSCDDVLEHLQNASIASSYQTTILNDTLSLSRIATRKIEVQPAMCTVDVIVEEVSAIVAPTLRRKGVVFNVVTVSEEEVKAIVRTLSHGEEEGEENGGEGEGGASQDFCLWNRRPRLSRGEQGRGGEERQSRRGGGREDAHTAKSPPTSTAFAAGHVHPLLEGDRKNIVKIATTLIESVVKETEKGGCISILVGLVPLVTEDVNEMKRRQNTCVLHPSFVRKLNCKFVVEVRGGGKTGSEARLSNAFLRADQKRRNSLDNYLSSGLELAIAKELAESIHGSVEGLTQGEDETRMESSGKERAGITLRFEVAVVLAALLTEEERTSHAASMREKRVRRAGPLSTAGRQKEKEKAAAGQAKEERGGEGERGGGAGGGEGRKSGSHNSMVKKGSLPPIDSSSQLVLAELDESASKNSKPHDLFPPTPTVASADGANTLPSPSPSAPLPPPHVLIVEDNEMNQKILQRFLKKLKLKFTPALNGQEAVDLFVASLSAASPSSAPSSSFDFAFMDIRMPVKDGMEATRDIRQIEEENGMERLPIVALSGNTEDKDKEDAYAAGIDHYMTKPYKMGDIRSAVETFVPSWKSEKEV